MTSLRHPISALARTWSRTPDQGVMTYGCPGGATVSCSNGPSGDMWMNYMDYSDDPCMYMFSAGAVGADGRDALWSSVSDRRLRWTGPTAHDGAADLWSQDRPEDPGSEPDPVSAPMWESDDIWVRKQNDGFTNQEHQNPEYRPAGFGSNFVYVRVRNRACGSSGSGDLYLYWAKGLQCLGLARALDGSVTSPALMGGSIGNKPTGVIPAGGSAILEFPWYPPDPAKLRRASVPISDTSASGAHPEPRQPHRTGLTFPRAPTFTRTCRTTTTSSGRTSRWSTNCRAEAEARGSLSVV